MEMIGEPKPLEIEGVAAETGEETVEFELTAEQQLQLWQAAGGLAGRASEQSGMPEYDVYVCRRTDRVDRVCTIAFATLVLGLTVVTGWRAIDAAPSAIPVVARVRAAPVVATPAQPQPAVVQVINPFDASEVFELPADTSESDARNAIAELLLQRARERLRQGFDVHRVTNRHVHATAGAPLDVFVTRVSGPEDRLGGIAGLNTERAQAD